MSYDNPIVATYMYPVLTNFGTSNLADGVFSFKGPAGHKGRVIDCGVMGITEAFAGTTTDAKLNLGATAGAAEYVAMSIPAATAVGDTFNSADDTDAITGTHIPADQQCEVSIDVATGGTPAGIGYPFFVIGWYK